MGGEMSLSYKRFNIEVPGAGWLWVVAEEEVKKAVKEIESKAVDDKCGFCNVSVECPKCKGKIMGNTQWVSLNVIKKAFGDKLT